MSPLRRTAHQAGADAAGKRLDAWLALQPGAPTRSQIKAAADEERLLVAGRPARVSLRLKGGEAVELLEHEADPASAELVGEAIDLDVLFEDEHMLAINKPVGMVVHPAAGSRSGTLVHALLHRDPALAWPGEPGRAGIVHRLDRDTSGLILVARTVRAHEALSRQFRDRTVCKTYLAVVQGRLKEPMRIDLPIGRHPTERKRMSVTGRPARAAVSDVTPLEALGAFTLVQVRPKTGRTHQIRVHLSAKGFPLVGDRVYGGKPLAGFARQALHAAAIEFDRPGGEGRMEVQAPLPEDLEALLAMLRRAAAG